MGRLVVGECTEVVGMQQVGDRLVASNLQRGSSVSQDTSETPYSLLVVGIERDMLA